MNHDVFISYSRKDIEMANQICAALERSRISYFIDRKDINGGAEFIDIIIRAINQSRLFLFLASRNSYASRITLDEVFEALDGVSHGERKIVTYIIDDSELPHNLRFQLRRYNWRTRSEHPIEPTLINDLKVLLQKQECDDRLKKACAFSDGLARIKDENGKWGFIDKQGLLIAPCQFIQARDYKYGVAVVQKQDGKWVYMNGNGEIINDEEDEDSLSFPNLSPEGMEVNAKISWEFDQEMKKSRPQRSGSL